MQTVVDSQLIDYQRQGLDDAPTLLLLHGWGVERNNVAPLAAELAKNYDVISPSLPGFGSSQPPAEPWDAHDYAKFIGKFADKLELKPDVVVGHSMGGQIAIAAVGNKYLQPEVLCLIATAGVRRPNSLRNKLYRIAAKVGKAVLSIFPKSVQIKAKNKLYTQTGASDYRQVAASMKPTLQKVLADDVRVDAANITQPTLFICGADDDSTPLADIKQLHQAVTDSELQVIAGAGHHLHSTHTAQVVELINNFLGKTL